MNELSNFCDGECQSGISQKNLHNFTFNPQRPPYLIQNQGNSEQPLNSSTINPSAGEK
jgi:hypothetical protein